MIAIGRVSWLVRQRSSIKRCVMAIASAPPVTPMPHCLDCRSCLVVAVLSASRIRRVITLRIHSPTWIGLTFGVLVAGLVCGVGVWSGGPVCVCWGGGGSSTVSSKSLSLSLCGSSWVGRSGKGVVGPSVGRCRGSGWALRRIHVAMASPPRCRASSSLQIWIHLASSSSSTSC